MERLKQLLSCLDAESDVEKITKTFEDIAEILLFKSYIKAKDGNYRMLEIEFYFKNINHKDEVTIIRKEKAGMWWLHDWGVDLTFMSEGKDYCGGILIRSIAKINDKNEMQEPMICGPRNCCWELFYSCALEKDSAPQIIVGNKRMSGAMKRKKRILSEKSKKEDGDYRFYVEELDIEPNTKYKDSPWK
jgi:hypothetical protein